MKVSINNASVIDSGVLLTSNNEDVLLSISDTIKLRLKFQSDLSQTSHNFEYRINAQDEMEFVFVNFNSPEGLMLSQPFILGTNDKGSKMYLNMRVIGHQKENNKMIVYTIYID